VGVDVGVGGAVDAGVYVGDGVDEDVGIEGAGIDMEVGEY
jgi:hypothetical protein